MSTVVTESGVGGADRGAEEIADPGRLLDEFLEWLTLHPSAQSVKTYRSALQDFIRRMGIHDLQLVDEGMIERFRGRLFLAQFAERIVLMTYQNDGYALMSF